MFNRIEPILLFIVSSTINFYPVLRIVTVSVSKKLKVR
jgi:hypothetical protein